MALKAFVDTILVAEYDKDIAKSSIQLPPGVSAGPNRGVVVDCGTAIEPHLEPGTLVYYCDHQHPVIGNATVVPYGCVMAYEELES